MKRKTNLVTFISTILFLILGASTLKAQDWTLTGNSITGIEKLGTTNNYDLSFITNNNLRMTLNSTGRLGLGTSSPNGMMEIDYCLAPNPNNGGLVVTKTLCPTGFTLVPYDPNQDVEIIGVPFDFGFIGSESDPNQIKVPFSFKTGHTTNVSQPLFGTNGPLLWARTKGDNGWLLSNPDNYDTKFIVMPDGSCGINIAQPRAALDIRGARELNHPAAIIGSLVPGTYATEPTTNLPQYYTQQVQFVPVLSDDGYNRISQLGDQGMIFSDGFGTEGSNLQGALVIAPWAQESNAATVGGMRMDAMGNTEFHGTLRATKINIDAKWWSDFVFAEGYSLMSLSELEGFIKLNKHLPNMPSESEIMNEGIDVAEMQALQQLKIEELTLYIIQLQKQIEMMEAKLEKL